jgi:hypothetical protein
MMPAEQWYYRLDGRPHGPFTTVQFDKLIRGKTVTHNTDVSRDGKTWQSLRDLLAGVPADDPPSSSTSEWLNTPTLVPGDIVLPPGAIPDKTKPN